MNSPTATPSIVNVGLRLSETASRMPDGLGVAAPLERDRHGRRQYESLTFRQLDEDSTAIAAGLHAMGVEPGMRLVLMVRPGLDFISLVFALFKAGVVTVLIDPGMGRKNLIDCLSEVEPDGFVAIPLAHVVRTLLRRRFPKARFNVTVGRRWFWGGKTLSQLRGTSAAGFQPAATGADDQAAIIFTTGSTGPPKGVLYRHGNFSGQVDEIRDFYDIQPGEIDVPGFPLFALFNCAMGVSTVVPDMDFTRPAEVDPKNIIEAVEDFSATQAFGSPALWNAVGRYCEQHDVRLPTLRRALSAGAPVPVHVLKRVVAAIHEDGDMHTPYGATESLPVASIAASEVLRETAAKTAEGAGTCVGRRFGGIEWKVIRTRDEPLATIDDVEELPVGEIGEIIVRGRVVTSEYVTRTEANALHKIHDGDTFWHRIGDLGYLDESDRFWFCGRKAHRVVTDGGTMYTIPCEAIINGHPRVYRSALVGVGAAPRQRPVIVAEPWPEQRAKSADDEATLIAELRQLAKSHANTKSIDDVLLHDSLPVDIRHNAKIFREKLAVWAEERLR
ncbi:MAG: fatty acid CoA ligase family protein [Pirellulaceae bacterium]